MGALALIGLLAGVLWLAATDIRRYSLAVLTFAGLPMPIFTGGARFLPGPLEIDAQAAYMFVVFLGCVLALVLRLGRALPEAARHPWLLAFLAFALASLAWADSFVYGARMLVKLAAPVAFMLVVSLAVAEGLTPRAVGRALYAAALLSLGIAAVNVASGGALGPLVSDLTRGWFGWPQFAAPYTSPSNFSFTLSVAVLVAYAGWLARRRAVYPLLATLLLVGIVLALCRAALAGLVLGLIAFHLPAGRIRLWHFAAGSAAVLAATTALVQSDAFKQRMFFEPDRVVYSQLFTDREAFFEQLNTSGRNQIWAEAVRDFESASPLVGEGVGAVDRWVRDRDERGNELHSDVFRLYLDLGGIGLGLYFAALAALALRLRRVIAADAGEAEPVSPLARAALASLVCFAATLSTDNSLNYVTQFGVCVFGLVGLALGPVARVAAVRGAARETGARPPATRRFANVVD